MISNKIGRYEDERSGSLPGFNIVLHVVHIPAEKKSKLEPK